jgi:hypothetical protein
MDIIKMNIPTNNTYKSANIDVAVTFNPNDYIYVGAGDLMPTQQQCNDPNDGYIFIYDGSCNPNSSLWADYSMNCYKKQLCLNEQYATQIMNMEMDHLGTNQNYMNLETLQMKEYLRMFNLGIGMVGLVAGIFYLYTTDLFADVPKMPEVSVSK